MPDSSSDPWLPLSPARRLLGDLVQVAQTVPTASVERRMRLHLLAGLRAMSWPRPGWCAVFVKAFAILAGRRRELRQHYVRWPWPHVIEQMTPGACVPIGRVDDVEDQEAVHFARLDAPERLGLAEIDRWLRDCQERPLDSLPAFAHWRTLLGMPALVRSLVCRVGSAWSARFQASVLGTYAVNTVAGSGASCVQQPSPWPLALSYGLVGKDGCVDVRLTYDPRLRDAVTAARLLGDLEDVLTKELASELRYMQNVADAA